VTGFTDPRPSDDDEAFARRAVLTANVLGQDPITLAQAAIELATFAGLSRDDALERLARNLTADPRVLARTAVTIHAPRWERTAHRIPVVRDRIRIRWRDRAIAAVKETATP
jgi:hypothetical protein